MPKVLVPLAEGFEEIEAVSMIVPSSGAAPPALTAELLQSSKLISGNSQVSLRSFLRLY